MTCLPMQVLVHQQGMYCQFWHCVYSHNASPVHAEGMHGAKMRAHLLKGFSKVPETQFEPRRPGERALDYSLRMKDALLAFVK